MQTLVSESNQDATDESIALLVIEGDKELFGVLIDRYEQKIARYIRKFTQEKEDISDIVQTVFIKAYTNLASFDTTRSFNSWIYRIAHNESVNHLKKKTGEKIAFIDFDTFFPHPFSPFSPEIDFLSKESKEQLEKSLTHISPKYREVLVLYYYEELSYQEIADVLRIPVATVGVRLKRAKTALEKSLLDNHYQS
jgi:RNA polymerase sigma-70 factor (ECF subfamily)